MRLLRRIVGGLRALVARGQVDRDLDDELRGYLDAAIERHILRGLSREEATRAARREFGSASAVKDRVRSVGWESLVDDCFRDARYAIRALRRSPVFTAVAVVTLALGIGANTAIFTVVNATMIRPLNDDVLARLVRVFHTELRLPPPNQPTAAPRVARMTPSIPTFVEWQRRNDVFEGMAIWRATRLTLLDSSPLERVNAVAVTPGLLKLFNARAAHGRLFLDTDTNEPVAVISYGAWQRRFGADPGVVGRIVRTLEGPRTIVGVLPAEFRFLTSDFWVPLVANEIMAKRAGWGGQLVALLKSDVTLVEAQRNMESLNRRLASEGLVGSTAGVAVESALEFNLAPRRPMIFILMGAVGVVLLIACVNVAGLLVARGVNRSREIGVRAAIGAGRLRIVRQMLTESLALAAFGGAAGVILAWWTLDLLTPLLPVPVDSQFAPTIDFNALAFATSLSVVTALLFGLLPALRLSRASVTTQLRDIGHSNPRWALRTGTALVVVQTALALTLMAAAGLLIRSLQAVLAIDPGFQPERVLVVEATPVMLGEGQQQRALAFYTELLRRVGELPGVETVGAIDTLPFRSYRSWVVDIDGPERRKTSLGTRRVTPGYFASMGIPIRAGRDFSVSDSDGTPCVAIVNDLAARRYWPGGSPLGQRVRRQQQPWCEIVGVVGNIHHRTLEDDADEEVFLTALQPDPVLDTELTLTLVARASRPSALIASARALTTRLSEPALVGQVASLSEGVDRLVFNRRSRALWLSALGVLGVLLAAIGMFGLTSYAVARKTSEIGIRIALGATDRRVLRTVVGAFVPAIAGGVVLGLLGSWALTRVLKSVLYGVTPTDPLTFSSVSLLLTAVALFACYLPARRATTIDPMTALRCE